jgi:hypothetical protein
MMCDLLHQIILEFHSTPFGTYESYCVKASLHNYVLSNNADNQEESIALRNKGVYLFKQSLSLN